MPTSVIFILVLQSLLFSSSVKSISLGVSFGSSERAKTWLVKPSFAPASSPSPSYQGPSVTPRPKHHCHHGHHHSMVPYAVAPSPSKDQACVCTDPLTSTPYGSPCGCVFPIKVRLTLDVAPYAVFPVMNELELEVALGTYLEQSQVKIMGASADSQNQGRTIVDIYLVPLGEKFDDTTAALTYERFWHKKVPLNKSLFGDYAVVYITYPGIPSSPPYGSSVWSGPSESADGILPVSANFGSSKNQKMNLRTLVIIALSSFVLLLVLVGAFSFILKWRKIRRPPNAVGPAFTSSLNKRSGLGSMLSSSITSSTSVSLMSTMATSILSVKYYYCHIHDQ